MNSQQLLIINFIIFAGLILLFFIGRAKPKQFLNLTRNPPNTQNQDFKNASEESMSFNKQKTSDKLVVVTKEKSGEFGGAENKKPHSKNNSGDEIVYFVFNGHEWEAHEVLGIECGSSLEKITVQYQNLIKTSDPSTFEFYEAAYSAVLKLRNPKW